jgi:hypothetical protein
MLLEEQFPIKKETQIAPNGLRAKGGSPCKQGIAKIDGKGTKTPTP